jgi:hypothetical protein
MISNNDPGALGLRNPQIMTKSVIDIVERIPSNENIDKIGNGTNVNGVKTRKLNILNLVLVQTSSSPSNAYNESLNNTTNATPAPNKSTVNSKQMTALAVGP